MSPITTTVPPEDVAAALKVRTIGLLVLKIYDGSLTKIDRILQEKAQQGPDFFKNSPVLLDFSSIAEDVDPDWLTELSGIVESNHFIPVGITGAPATLEESAASRGIAIWPLKNDIQPDRTENHTPPKPEKKELENGSSKDPAPARIVKQPVRSGQRIYAEGGDLIVMAAVNTGAEIMADGHIHVYGTLRGRAMAGVKGRQDAQIFCHDLQADLVAIAGYYTIHEDLPEERRSTAVQISLDGESLIIDPLNP